MQLQKKERLNNNSDDKVIVILKELSKKRNNVDLKGVKIEHSLLELEKDRQER